MDDDSNGAPGTRRPRTPGARGGNRADRLIESDRSKLVFAWGEPPLRPRGRSPFAVRDPPIARARWAKTGRALLLSRPQGRLPGSVGPPRGSQFTEASIRTFHTSRSPRNRGRGPTGVLDGLGVALSVVEPGRRPPRTRRELSSVGVHPRLPTQSVRSMQYSQGDLTPPTEPRGKHAWRRSK